MVVFSYDVVHVIHATVVDIDIVFVEDVVIPAGLGEVFLDD